MSIDGARAVADAVLYEGYLLYPYRASSTKNQSRWQFGVLGPPGALAAGTGEDAVLATELLVRSHRVGVDPVVTVDLRFLQLQERVAERARPLGEFEPVAELAVGARRWLTWDEAVEREVAAGPWLVTGGSPATSELITVAGGSDVETVLDHDGQVAGRIVRRRRPLTGRFLTRIEVTADAADLFRLAFAWENTAEGAAADPGIAIATSFIGAHLLIQVENGDLVSMTDPPVDARAAAAACDQHRCWPVLAGPDGDASIMLVSPIILPDHPELAPQSAGALFDSTEIDEILTLRVMTLTDEEKAAARATDPRAGEIIDRCDAMSPEAMQQLHGILRDPHGRGGGAAAADAIEGFEPGESNPRVDLTASFGFDGEVPWWDPAVDGSVAPETDEVSINGVAVSAGSIVRVHPSRRADAQDLFFADQVARVTAVHSDVDGETHVAVVLVDDPAADLHEWYGRYLYFAPDELEPLSGSAGAAAVAEVAASFNQPEESRS